MVLTLIARSPREPGFLAPVIARLVAARLGTSVGAPGPHALTVPPRRRSSARKIRARRQSVHRIPASRVVTIAIRPSASRRDDGNKITYSDFRKQKCFAEGNGSDAPV